MNVCVFLYFSENAEESRGMSTVKPELNQCGLMQGPCSGIAMEGFKAATCQSVILSEVTRRAVGWGTSEFT